MNLAMTGINFRTAPLNIREKISFSENQATKILKYATQEFPETEAATLSTCNRTELYIAGPYIEGKNDSFINFLLKLNGLEKNKDIRKHFYFKEALDAAKHLLAVASSLDSMVVGETEILGQVKKAHALALSVKTSGKVLNRLFQTAVRTGKKVHTETDICRGCVSVSSIAVEFAEKVFDNLKSKRVMVVGAGEMSELTLKSLMKKGVKDITILNRSLDKSNALAQRYNGQAIDFELLENHLPHADIVISSTNAPHCVITADLAKKSAAARRGRPIFFIDIAVPRDIEEKAGTIDNVYLYNIDDLQKVAATNLEKRQQSVDNAWKIINEEAIVFSKLAETISHETLMKELTRFSDDVKETELNRIFSKEEINSIPEHYRKEIEEMAHRITKRILAMPRKTLAEAVKNGHWEKYSKLARSLFGFHKEKQDANK
ncbi:glutamyl-tRNA reductase [Verrucomicrobiota bacterium]